MSNNEQYPVCWWSHQRARARARFLPRLLRARRAWMIVVPQTSMDSAIYRGRAGKLPRATATPHGTTALRATRRAARVIVFCRRRFFDARGAFWRCSG